MERATVLMRLISPPSNDITMMEKGELVSPLAHKETHRLDVCMRRDRVIYRGSPSCGMRWMFSALRAQVFRLGGNSMSDIKSLQQVERPQLKGHQVHFSNVQHLVIIDDVVVPCTPTEYNLLLLLLNHAGEAVPYTRLLGIAGQQFLTHSNRHSLIQHMSNLRARLCPLGLDLACLTGYGYLLLSMPKGQAKDR